MVPLLSRVTGIPSRKNTVDTVSETTIPSKGSRAGKPAIGSTGGSGVVTRPDKNGKITAEVDKVTPCEESTAL